MGDLMRHPKCKIEDCYEFIDFGLSDFLCFEHHTFCELIKELESKKYLPYNWSQNGEKYLKCGIKDCK
jgi:hypothetical protein